MHGNSFFRLPGAASHAVTVFTLFFPKVFLPAAVTAAREDFTV
ncbi:hypothetical protein QQF45_17025 [Halopseudomonas aestusnigri]|jgi:hypothetical protein|nr:MULTISPECIES: hypothetical protein [Halopseudomonas]MDL2200748.1 hypothetical protein [Halopseudomonas aestusnigri]